jgi:hypothetical protein
VDWAPRFPGAIQDGVHGRDAAIAARVNIYERDFLVFKNLKDLGVPVAWNLAGGYQHDACIPGCAFDLIRWGLYAGPPARSGRRA